MKNDYRLFFFVTVLQIKKDIYDRGLVKTGQYILIEFIHECAIIIIGSDTPF